MKTFLKQLKLVSLLDAIFEVVFAFLLIFCTNFTIKTLAILFAVFLLVVGVVKIIDYFLYGYEPFGFVFGIISILVGVICFASLDAIVGSNLLGIVFGTILIVKSLISIQESFDLRRRGAKYWWIDTTLSALVLILAIAVVFNPSASILMFTLLGITLLIDGILNLIDIFVVSAKVKKVKKSFKDMFKKDDDNIIDIE